MRPQEALDRISVWLFLALLSLPCPKPLQPSGWASLPPASLSYIIQIFGSHTFLVLGPSLVPLVCGFSILVCLPSLLSLSLFFLSCSLLLSLLPWPDSVWTLPCASG